MHGNETHQGIKNRSETKQREAREKRFLEARGKQASRSRGETRARLDPSWNDIIGRLPVDTRGEVGVGDLTGFVEQTVENATPGAGDDDEPGRRGGGQQGPRKAVRSTTKKVAINDPEELPKPPKTAFDATFVAGLDPKSKEAQALQREKERKRTTKDQNSVRMSRNQSNPMDVASDDEL